MSLDMNAAASTRGLQDSWYNFLVELISLDSSMFQAFQPAGPIAANDSALWDVIDIIPPASQTFSPALGDAVRFSDRYAAVVSQLATPAPSLAQAIGEANERAWSAFVGTLSPPPARNQLAALFQNWAARNAINAAPAGVDFLSRAVLAETEMPSAERLQTATAGAADFVGGYADLLALLRASPGCRGTFDSARGSADDGRWTRGGDIPFDGLWPGSGDAPPSRAFAASHVTASIGFGACAGWTVTPGSWYSSSLLNTAFSTAASPPWRVDAKPCWHDFFGPGGSMLRALASALFVDGVHITVTSDATFDAADQRTIEEHAAAGLWPLYAPTSAAVRTSVEFGISGTMQIVTVIASGHPIALGGNVLGIARYLGHAT